MTQIGMRFKPKTWSLLQSHCDHTRTYPLHHSKDKSFPNDASWDEIRAQNLEPVAKPLQSHKNSPSAPFQRQVISPFQRQVISKWRKLGWDSSTKPGASYKTIAITQELTFCAIPKISHFAIPKTSHFKMTQVGMMRFKPETWSLLQNHCNHTRTYLLHHSKDKSFRHSKDKSISKQRKLGWDSSPKLRASCKSIAITQELTFCSIPQTSQFQTKTSHGKIEAPKLGDPCETIAITRELTICTIPKTSPFQNEKTCSETEGPKLGDPGKTIDKNLHSGEFQRQLISKWHKMGEIEVLWQNRNHTKTYPLRHSKHKSISGWRKLGWDWRAET